jgi:NADH-quinone oxidoreductase subunit E
MLTEEMKRKIRGAIAEMGGRGRAACIDALRLVQETRRWVNDEDLHDLAAFLEISPAELESVATFYNLIYRQPVGKHVIHLCNSVSCWTVGYERIKRRIESLLNVTYGGTTADGKFTLLPVACLGVCDRAPAMMIDGRTYMDLTEENVGAIFASLD